MILTKNSIRLNYGSGRIRIDPFAEDRLSTNSYDIALGNQLIKYTDEVIDTRKPTRYETISVDPAGYLMKSGEFLLGHSQEKIGSDFYVPLLHGKSNTARQGLFVHVTADLIDIGYYGNLTLQLFATVPVRIYPGMLIGQVTFWTPEGKVELYDGKYQGTEGASVSKIFRDLE